jgi:hypothetical protein
MKLNIQIFLSLLIFFYLANSDNGFSNESTPTAWDTVIAQLKIIDSGKQADSIKAELIHQVFEEHGIGVEDYRTFYQNFFERSPENQVKFLKRVEKIIQNHLKEFLVPDPETDPRNK